MSGQLALALREETVVPAAVWETLPPRGAAAGDAQAGAAGGAAFGGRAR